MTVTAINPTTSRVTGDVAVNYSGNLVTDGLPVTLNPINGPFQLDVANFTDTLAQTVNATTSYIGRYTNTALPNSILADVQAGRAAYFPNYDAVTAVANSITVNASGFATDLATGFGYDYSLAAPAPTTIIGGNSVALTGSFSGNDNGVIQMGTLSGTAVLKAGRATTIAPGFLDANGNPTGGWSSPYQMEYNITAELKTQLDGNGLITPTVSVTNGVNMNGSTVTNLAAGVNPTDAVNKAQLDAVVAGTAFQGGSVNSLQIGPGSTAGGGAAVAVGYLNTATGNGAVAIGDPNVATGTGAVAIGADNTATGNGSVAIGNLTIANGAGNVALGNGAQATAANSVALGGASIADQANTVSVGAVGSERRVTNVAAGTGATDAVNFGQLTTVSNAAAAAQTTATAAQTSANTAQTTAVAAQTTANSAQTVATAAQATANTAQTTAVAAQGVASNAQAAAVTAQTVATAAQTGANSALAQNATQDTRMNAMDVLNNTQNSRLAALEALSTGRIDALEGRVDRIDRMANGGIAAAMAMGGTMVVPDSTVSMSFNIATYRGQQGFSGAIVGRIAPKVYINAGVAGSTIKKSTGGRVGVTFGW
jgi:autotransporter adhesin